MALRISQQIVIVAGKRTPFACPLSHFGKIPAPMLAAHSIIGALKAANITSDMIDSAIFGCGIQTGLGHNPVKQALLSANLDNDIPCTTVNQGHCSGSKSVILAYRDIITANNEIVLCGGFESVSLCPYMMKQGRAGTFGDIPVEDCYVRDGLHDPFIDAHSGMVVERTNSQLQISRIDLDV